MYQSNLCVCMHACVCVRVCEPIQVVNTTD